MIFASDPEPEQLLVVVVTRWLETVDGGVEPSEVNGVDLVVVGLFHAFYFFHGEARMADTLDTVVEFP